MGISNPDYYWERIKNIWKFVLSSFALVMLSAAVFGSSGLTGFISLIFALGLIVGAPAFVYYCYKDKQTLTTRFKDINERHWLTVAVFMLLSNGIYAPFYTLDRMRKYDPQNPNQTETGVQKLLVAGRSVQKRLQNGEQTGDGGPDSTERSRSTASNSAGGATMQTTSGSDVEVSAHTDTSTKESASSTKSDFSSVTVDANSSDTSGGTADSSSENSSDTSVFVADDEDETGDTEVYQPGGGSDTNESDAESSTETDEESTDNEDRFCSHCGTYLRPHGNPSFCPDCGQYVASSLVVNSHSRHVIL